MRPLMMLLLIMLAASNQSCSSPLQPALAHRILPQDAYTRVTNLRNSTERQRAVAVSSAQKLLQGKIQAAGLLFEPDPIGFVRAAWWEAGIDLFSERGFHDAEMNGMEVLYRAATARNGLFKKQPQPGDLIFLGNPRSEQNPVPSQVALVEFIDAEGTVYALGRFAEGPGRIRLNLNLEKQNSLVMSNTASGPTPTEVSIRELFWTYARPY